MRAVPAFALLIACSQTGVKVYNTPPAVSILQPTSGQTFAPDDLVEFYGVAQDSQDEPTSLLISWSSNLDGTLGTDPPDAEGTVYLAAAGLSGGDHAITLTAVDLDGESGTTSVQITVGYGTTSEGAPTVVLTGPAEGATFLAGQTVSFVGVVTDNEQAWDTVTTRLYSNVDGSLWSGNPDSGGVVSADVEGLSVGDHVITLEAEDADGHTSSDTVDITIGEDGRPTAAITSPATGTSVSTDDTVLFEGLVSDEETDTELLSVTWSSSLDGVLGTGAPDSSGYTAVATHLSEGTHIVTLTVVDGDGKEGSTSETITVVDPNNVDDDRDGYTENEGDCDDTDISINPGEAEICDAYDNDCDGSINEDFEDAYEPDETTGTAYDLGEVDSTFLWAGSTASLSGLTLHNSGDVDCFHWGADDEYYDNVSISVTVGTFSSAGSYVATLYMWDGSAYVTKDSDSGSARLGLSYDGDWLDDEEDDWVICVAPVSWARSVCDGTMPYTIQISS